jgi:hypothetical protein
MFAGGGAFAPLLRLPVGQRGLAAGVDAALLGRSDPKRADRAARRSCRAS